MIKKYILGICLFFGLVYNASANIFPENSITQHFDITQNYTTGITLLSSGSNIIYNISFNRYPTTTIVAYIYCGGVEVWDTQNATIYDTLVHINCNDIIKLYVNGYSGTGGLAHIIFTYTTYTIMELTPLENTQQYGIAIFSFLLILICFLLPIIGAWFLSLKILKARRKNDKDLFVKLK